MQLPKAKYLFLAGLAFCSLLAFAVFSVWKARQALRSATEQVSAAENLKFTVALLDGAAPGGAEWISSPAVFGDAAFFEGRLYCGGSSGLLAYSPEGKLLARYRAGMEMPAAPLVGMSVGRAADAVQPELYLATAGAGLLAISEKGLRQILPQSGVLRRLTAVLPLATGRVLLGTEKDGVLVYDGSGLAPFHPQLANLQITALAGDDANLWAGTLADGVIHWHAGRAERFSEAQGLPDPRVLALAVDGERTFVGTPLGVAEFRAGQFTRRLAASFFANSLLVEGESLLVGTLDEGVVQVPLAASPAREPRPQGQEIPGRIVRLLSAAGSLYALTDCGFYSLNARGGAWRPVIEREASLLADRNVSALEFDPLGRLWVGYFDRGLDVLSPGEDRATHLEDEHVFCVNRIVHDARHDATYVATANGLVVFDGALHKHEVLGRKEGLIADHVTDLVLTAEGMTLATPAGLTFLTPGGARSIYAFHGLINNHVYTVASEGTRLLAGTLGGLSVLDGGQVLSSYTTANSGLKANWITALAPVGDGWFVGTYGAGILRLGATGRFQTFADLPGAFVVNPNAMLSTAERIYAGTLDRGLYVYDRFLGRWSNVTSNLPSANVTALAVRNGFLYMGTDNGLIKIPERILTSGVRP
jgi:ligand-binding sensor domain-containing protein